MMRPKSCKRDLEHDVMHSHQGKEIEYLLINKINSFIKSRDKYSEYIQVKIKP